MRFGEFILEKRVPGWEGNYIDYELLKKQLLTVAATPAKSQLMAEHKFKEAVLKQLSTVNSFFATKLKSLQMSLDPAVAKPNSPTKQGWIDAADEKSRDVKNLEEYAYINYEGFRKILKKHDKNCKVPMLASFMIDLQHSENSFWKLSRQLRQCVDGVVAMYERGGRYENLVLEPLEKPEADDGLDFSEGGVKKAFIRKNHKFWVPRHRFYELMCRLSAYMPLYYFGEKYVDPLTTSVYLDNDNLDMYARRLRREDGATLIRYRVYGDDHPSPNGVAFVERKTHCEAIYGGESRKERFQIHEHDIEQCIAGGAVEVVNAGKKDEELAAEISAEINQKQIRPYVTTRYFRSVFQKDTDDRLRISVDSNLTMTKEFHIFPWQWHSQLSRVPDTDEYHEFPYVVMELKLRDVHMPEWFLKLVHENLVMEVPKFSKFLHSCVVFRKSDVPELPYWIEDNPADFGYIFTKGAAGDGNGIELAEIEPDRGMKTGNAHVNLEDTITEANWCSCLPSPGKYGQLKEGQKKQVSGGGRPVKMDPKAFLANERTFLNWNQQAITLCTFGVALLSMGDSASAVIAGLMMSIIGTMVLLYAQYQYIRRWTLFRNRASGLLFLDIKGPVLLTIFLTITFSLAVIFHISPPATGQHIIKMLRNKDE